MVKISEGVERVTASATALEAAADNTTSMKQYIADIARVATEQSQGNPDKPGIATDGAGYTAKCGVGISGCERQPAAGQSVGNHEGSG